MLGSLAHASLELAMREPDVDEPDWHALADRAIDLLEAKRAAEPWKDEPIPPGAVKPDGTPATRADWTDAAARKLTGFRLSDALQHAPEPAAMEQRVDADVWGIPMRGEVDYRDESGVVVDWKTGSVPARADGKRRHADQLRVYKALLETAGVCGVRGARDVYVEHRAFHPADLSGEAMMDTGLRLRNAWTMMNRAIGEGVYPLLPSGLCAWCPLANNCPLAVVRGAKAMAAAKEQLPRDPERFVHVDSTLFDGFHPAGTHEPVDRAATPTEDAAASGECKEQDMAEPIEDPWADAGARAALDKWGVKPPREATAPSPAPAPMPAPTPPMVECRRPSAPSMGADRVLNPDGYGTVHLTLTAARAGLIAPTPRDVDATLVALLKAQWCVARQTWGATLVPDIPGLAQGAPDRKALCDWMDSCLCRDADRALRIVMDGDDWWTRMDPKPGLPAVLERVGHDARLAAASLTAMRRLIA